MGAFGFNRDSKETEKLAKKQEKLKKKADRKQWARDRSSRRQSFDRGVSLGALILVMLLVAALLSKLQNNSIPNFSSFLSYLQTVPTLDIDWAVIPQVSFESSWLGWAEVTINFITSIINFFGYITKSGINALTFILWILYFFIY